MSTVAERINKQHLAFDYQKESTGKGVAKITNFAIPVNSWQQLLPINTSRSLLHIKSTGGNLGYCRVEMALDRENRNATFDIEDFAPRFIPTNAVYVYVSDPLTTGSTVVNVQVLEG